MLGVLHSGARRGLAMGSADSYTALRDVEGLGLTFDVPIIWRQISLSIIGSRRLLRRVRQALQVHPRRYGDPLASRAGGAHEHGLLSKSILSQASHKLTVMV